MKTTCTVDEADTCLTDDLFLEVEGRSDDRDRIVVEITAVMSRGRVHSDKFL